MSDNSLILATLFKAEIKNFITNVRVAQNAVKKYAEGVQIAGQKVQAAVIAQEKLAQEQNKTAISTEKARQAQIKTAAMQDKATAAAKKNTQALAGNTAGVKKSHDQMFAHGKQLSKITGAWNRLKAAARVTISYGIAATAIYSMVNAAKAAVTEIATFDQAIQNLNAIIGKVTQSQLTAMGNKLIDVARVTKFSTGEISGGMQLLAQAGFSAEESLSAIGAVADLATGTLSTLATTSDLLTTATRAFGLEASEAGRIADVMASSINHSKLTIDKLRTSFNFVGASAAQVGLSLEEVAATMQILANAGLRASTIGTGFRQVLAKLVAPSRALREEFENHNIALSEVNPSVVGYQTAMENLTKVLWDNEKGTVNMAKAYDLFKLRGAQAAAVIVSGFVSGQFDKAIKNVYEVGTAAEMSAKQQDGLIVKFKNLKDRAGIFAIALGDAGLTGVIHYFVDAMKNGLESLENFVKSGLGKSIIQTTALAVSFGLVFTAVKMLAGAISGALFTSFTSAALSQNALNVGLAIFRANLVSATSIFGVFKVLITSFISPATALVLAFTGLSVAVYRTLTAHTRAAEAADQAAVAHKTLGDNLSGLVTVLSSVEEGSDRYRSAIARFREENQETAKSISDLTGVQDISTLSFQDFQAAAESVNMTEAIAQVNSMGDALEAWTNKSKQEGLFADFMISDSTKTEVLRRVDEISLAISALASKSDDVTIQDFVDELASTSDIPQETLSLIFDKATKAAGELAEQQEQVKLRFDELVEGVEEAGDKISKSYEGLYKDLSLLDQTRLTEVMSKIDKEIAEYKRKADAVGHTEEQQYAAEIAIRANALADFVASTHKEEDTKAESLARREKIYQNALVKETATIDKQIAQRASKYNEEVKAAEEAGKSTLEITKSYQDDITSLLSKKSIIYKEINTEIVQIEKNLSKELLAEKEKSSKAEADQRKNALSLLLDGIKAEEAKGILTHEEAEKSKTKATVAEYKKILQEAEAHYAEVLKIYEKGSDEEIAAAQKVSDAKVSLVGAETDGIVKNVKMKKEALKEETKAEEDAAKERISIRQTEHEKSKALLEEKLQLINREVSQGNKSIAEGAAEKSVLTSQYYEKELKSAQWLYLKLRIFHWGDTEEKEKALERIKELKKQAIDFEISEEERLFQAVKKIRSNEIQDDSDILAQRLQAVDVLLSKGILTEKSAADEKAQINKDFYQAQIEEAYAYYNRLKKEEPERVDDIREAEKKIQQLKTESADFEIKERARVATAVKAMQEADFGLDQGMLNRRETLMLASYQKGLISAQEASRQKLDIEQEEIENVLALKNKAVQEAVAKYGIESAEYKKAVADRMAAEDDLMNKKTEIRQLDYELMMTAEAAKTAIIDSVYTERAAKQKEQLAEEISVYSAAQDQKIAAFLQSEESKTDATKTSLREYVVLERDANDLVIKFRNKASGEIVNIVRDMNGKILSATNEFEAKRQDAEEVALGVTTSLYDKKFLTIELMTGKHFQKMLSDEDKRFANEIASYEKQADKIGLSEEKKSVDLENIKLKHVTASKKIYQDEIDFWIGLLDNVKDKYQKLSDDLLDIKQQMVDAEKSHEEKLFDLKIKNMTDYQQYQEKQARFNEIMAKSEIERQLALEASTFEEKKLHLEASQTLIKEAEGYIGDLSNKVVEGETTFISAEKAKQTAISATNQTHTANMDILKELQKVTEAEQKSNLDKQKDINNQITATRELLEGLTETERELLIKINIDGADKVDSLLKDIGKLKDKTVNITVNKTTHERTVKESRWGGIVDKVKRLAAGAKLPGYGGGDKIDAKLEAGEGVLRKEAVRNIGADLFYDINNLKISRSDILSSLKAKIGGIITPNISVPVHRLAMQSGGVVPSFNNSQNMGSLNLFINNKEVGPIHGEIDVLQKLTTQIKHQQRLRKN